VGACEATWAKIGQASDTEIRVTETRTAVTSSPRIESLFIKLRLKGFLFVEQAP